jgi:hypothetical protein
MKKAICFFIKEIFDTYNACLITPVFGIFTAGFKYSDYNKLGLWLIYPIKALLTIPTIIIFSIFQSIFVTVVLILCFFMFSIVWSINFIFGGKLFEINVVYVFKKLFYKT